MHNEEKEELIDLIMSITGSLPPQTRYILRVLSHPEVVAHARAYFNSVDTTSRCTRYEAPWSCAQEAEARFENVKYGWLGSGGVVDEWWCENCRRRLNDV